MTTQTPVQPDKPPFRVLKQYRYTTNDGDVCHTTSRRRAERENQGCDVLEVWAILERTPGPFTPNGETVVVDCYNEEKAQLVCELLRTYRVAEQRATQAVAEANAEAG